MLPSSGAARPTAGGVDDGRRRRNRRMTFASVARPVSRTLLLLALSCCLPSGGAVFAPASGTALRDGVKACFGVGNLNYFNAEKCEDTSYGYINDWDVTGVQAMFHANSAGYKTGIFQDAKAFNQDLSKWDVQYATDMYQMFMSASAFNQDLSSWDVSKVTRMYKMFQDAEAFNGDISKWNVAKVTTIYNMFNGANKFKIKLNIWDVSSVTKRQNDLGLGSMCE